jgi:hypothetical protein
MKSRRVRIGLASILLLSVAVTVAVNVIPARAKHAVLLATLYGASNASVKAAVKAASWPQKKNNWCGVATVAAIAQFRGLAVTQSNVASYLNSTAGVSAWGTAPTSGSWFGPAFKADIAGDLGTDPRSLAAGLTAEAQAHYHQLVDLAGNYDATIHMVDDLVRTKEPISVIVFHGLHSVLVSGVTATANPVTNPSSITGLEVWDPGYGVPNGGIQAAQEVLVSMNTWLTSQYYWASPYNANYYGSIASDPDPAVGPYTYNPSHNNDYGHLWIGHYVYLRQDASTDPAVSVTSDWAFSQTGALITGFHGEVPTGYSGPTTSILKTTTLSDTSITGPAFWTDAAYHPATGTSSPAAVLAWIGTSSPHRLYVETSTDGFKYANKVVLGDTSPYRPSVIVVPSSTSNVVVLAWAGSSSSHALYVMYDVYGAKQKLILPYSSSYSPSLAYFAGQIWMAWTGTDSKHTLNVIALGPKGQTLGTHVTLSGDGSNAGPALVADPLDNELLLSWQMSSGSKLNFVTSSNGTTWTAGLPSPSSQTSNSTPAMMVIDPAPSGMPVYYWSWTSTSSSKGLTVMASSALGTWPSWPDGLPKSAIDAPELGYAGQANQILVAWTDASSSHHLNVSIVPA